MREARVALVVEDDPISQRVLTRLLERMGFAVESAAAGDEALTIARRIAPDVILLDLHMPIMDGRAFLSALRRDVTMAVLPPVIVLSADPGSATDLKTSGEVEIALVKPVQRAELEQALRDVGAL